MYFCLCRLSVVQNASYAKYYPVEKMISKYSKALFAAYLCLHFTVRKSHFILHRITLHHIQPVWFCHFFGTYLVKGSIFLKKKSH